ncbi:ThiF family adenylyltransferase [Mycolicibacterium neoaurum]|uniref:ThiF family adenylyltransferase n=1 Tax=Mycolicibacterium neoaurum TaxID=1795 RepID=UPI001F4CA5BD|nr:ThiF family adenylyltransferase [Mycolicibacterium neoaurum]
MHTYDDAAFDRFCSGLVNAGFSPGDDNLGHYWDGPLRPSLRPFTDENRMRIHIREGWPLRYAHVSVSGLRTGHASQGTICLWAEDDPAQIDGRELEGLWNRVDQWASASHDGFHTEDQALDAFFIYQDLGRYRAELPLQDVISRGIEGYSADVFGIVQGESLLIERGNPPDPRTIRKPVLHGAIYLRDRDTPPPRDFDEFRSALTRGQRRNLDRGIAQRSGVSFPEPSGGHDFVALTWPRHDGEHDALLLTLSGTQDELTTAALWSTPSDEAALRRRAGPDADQLGSKTVLLAGAGSVGGHVAVVLASSGVGTIHLHDSDVLTSTNVVRHVCPRILVGHRKAVAVGSTISQHAPWTEVTPNSELPYDPVRLRAAIADVHLVVDCTGVLPMTAALAETCHRLAIPMVSGALFHQGALARVQRQAMGDTPIAMRGSDPRYFTIPPDAAAPGSGQAGFLELGCTAPVNNAPPTSVLAAASDIAAAAVDALTGRLMRPDERITVLLPKESPFDRVGVLDPGVHTAVPAPQ